MRNLFVTLAATALAASMMSYTSQAGDVLKGAELEQLLAGNTLIGTNKQGTKFWVLYRDDGTARFAIGSEFRDKGKWQVSADGILCAVWDKLFDGKESCADNWSVDGDKVFFRSDGSVDQTSNRIVKGNPRKLK